MVFHLVVFPASKVKGLSETLTFGEISLSFSGNWLSFRQVLLSFRKIIVIKNPMKGV